jgi:GNAT superfamily N-acetyltransferase
MDLRSFEMAHAASVAGWATSAHEVSLLCGREEFPFPAELRTSWPKVAHDILLYLFLDGETPIGYGELWLDDDEDEVELARIIVAPEHRGKGLGYQLVQALLARALKARPLERLPEGSPRERAGDPHLRAGRVQARRCRTGR